MAVQTSRMPKQITLLQNWKVSGPHSPAVRQVEPDAPSLLLLLCLREQHQREQGEVCCCSERLITPTTALHHTINTTPHQQQQSTTNSTARYQWKSDRRPYTHSNLNHAAANTAIQRTAGDVLHHSAATALQLSLTRQHSVPLLLLLSL